MSFSLHIHFSYSMDIFTPPQSIRYDGGGSNGTGVFFVFCMFTECSHYFIIFACDAAALGKYIRHFSTTSQKLRFFANILKTHGADIAKDHEKTDSKLIIITTECILFTHKKSTQFIQFYFNCVPTEAPFLFLGCSIWCLPIFCPSPRICNDHVRGNPEALCKISTIQFKCN